MWKGILHVVVVAMIEPVVCQNVSYFDLAAAISTKSCAMSYGVEEQVYG